MCAGETKAVELIQKTSRPIGNRPQVGNLPHILVVCRLLLDMVDDHNGHGALLHLQFQPELLVEGVEKRDGPVRVRRPGCTARLSPPASSAAIQGAAAFPEKFSVKS